MLCRPRVALQPLVVALQLCTCSPLQQQTCTEALTHTYMAPISPVPPSLALTHAMPWSADTNRSTIYCRSEPTLQALLDKVQPFEVESITEGCNKQAKLIAHLQGTAAGMMRWSGRARGQERAAAEQSAPAAAA